MMSESKADLDKARGLVLLASMCFAAMYLCVKLTSARVSTFEVLFARSVLGVVIAGAVLARTGVTWRWGSLRMNALRSTFGFLSIASQFFAFHEGAVPLATVTFLRHAAPAWMLVLAGPMLNEWPDRRAKLAVTLGFVGTLLAFTPWNTTWSWSLVLAVAAGLFAALALLSVRKLAATDHPAAGVTSFMGVVALATGPFAIAGWVRNGFNGSARDAWLIAAAALLGTFGQLLNTSAYRYARAVSTAVASLLEVVLLVVLAWIFTADGAPAFTTLFGGAAIVAAGWVATTRRRDLTRDA